jgi:hypothetical protein
VRGDRAQQPARVHVDDHDEQLHGQEQVDGLEHFHHPRGWAAVEVVDVDDDPIDLGQRVARFIRCWWSACPTR